MKDSFSTSTDMPGAGRYNLLDNHIFNATGTYTVVATADPTSPSAPAGRVPESDNRFNNAATATFKVVAPYVNLTPARSNFRGWNILVYDTPTTTECVTYSSTGTATPTPGAPIDVFATTYNYGSNVATGPFSVRLVDIDRLGGVTAHATQTYSAFPACGVVQAAYSFQSHDRKTTPGVTTPTYRGMMRIRIEDDFGNTVPESAETDNIVSREMTDLSIGVATESVTFSPDSKFRPGSPAAGLPYTLFANYDAIGEMPYAPFQIRRAITLKPGQPGLPNACKNMTLPSLAYFPAPGEPPHDPALSGYSSSKTVPIGNVTFPSCGVDYWVDACITLDAGNCVGEPYEANNGGNPKKDCTHLLIHQPKPDLTVWRNTSSMDFSDLELSPTATGALGACNGVPLNTASLPASAQVCTGIKAVVTNVGESTATGVRVWLVRQPGNTTVDFGDSSFTLTTGASRTITFDEWLPRSGNYSLEVKVDPRAITPAGCNNTWGCITEYNENNNASQRDIPELELDGISVK